MIDNEINNTAGEAPQEINTSALSDSDNHMEDMEQPRNDADDLEALRNKYLHGGKSYKGGFASGYKDKSELITNILLLCAVALATICSVIWFAMPTMKLGGVTYNGKTQNILSFLFFGKDSMLESIKEAIKSAKDIDSNAFNAITSATRMVRLMVIGFVGVIVLLQTVICTVKAVIHFTKHNTIGLRTAAINNVAFKLMFYVCLTFFGSLSGGNGESAYYHGYSVGAGMTAGLMLSVCCLIAAVILTYLKRRGVANRADKEQFIRSCVACAGYFVIAIMLSLMNMFGVFMYAITSITQAIAYTVQYSFEFNVILFPILNIVIYAVCIMLYKRTVTGFTNAFLFLLTFDSNALIQACKPKKLKKFKKLLALSFTVPAVLSVVALTATLLLGIPSVGFGWSFDFFPYFIVIMTIASIGQILNGVLFKSMPEMPSLPEQTQIAARQS